MKKFINWFKQSNRWKHLLLGILIGIGSNSWYCTLYIGAGVSGALEFKDKQHGCKWDWIDFGLTYLGVIIGYCLRLLFLLCI